MTCREFWDCMPELHSGSSQHEHLRECAACSALLERQYSLVEGLRQLAEETRTAEAPAGVEAALVARFRVAAQSPAPRQPSRKQVLTWVLAAAAMIALAVISVDLRRGVYRPAPTGMVAHSVAVGAQDYSDPADSDFVLLPYSADAASEDEDVVDVEVPRSALTALGFPDVDDGGAERVRAEIALGPNGMPEAVRLLQ